MSLVSIMTPPKLEWSKLMVNQYPPERSSAASVVYKDYLFIHGGQIKNKTSARPSYGVLDDFWCYNFNTNTFHQVEVLSKENPGGRAHHSMVVWERENAILLFGGSKNSAFAGPNIWKYDIQTKMWKEIIPSGIGKGCRFGFMTFAFMHNEKLFAFKNSIAVCFDVDFICAFDFKTNMWTAIPTKGSIGRNRDGCAFEKRENTLYLYSNGLFTLCLDNFEWAEKHCAGSPPSPRRGHAVLRNKDLLYILGGLDCSSSRYPHSNSKRLASVVCCDMVTWSTLSAKYEHTPCRGRRSFVAHSYNDEIYLFGGDNSDGSCQYNDFYKLEIIPVSQSASYQSSCLATDFCLLVNNSEGSDVCFVIDEKKVYAHKCILSVRSEHFKWMLLGDNIQQGIKEIKVIDGTSHSTFLKVVEFLYTGGIGTMSLDIAIDLIVAAVKYRLSNLILLCEEFMRNKMSAKTAIRILNTCHKYNVYEMREDAIDFVISNWSDPDIKNELRTIYDINLLRELVLLKR